MKKLLRKLKRKLLVFTTPELIGALFLILLLNVSIGIFVGWHQLPIFVYINFGLIFLYYIYDKIKETRVEKERLSPPLEVVEYYEDYPISKQFIDLNEKFPYFNEKWIFPMVMEYVPEREYLLSDAHENTKFKLFEAEEEQHEISSEIENLFKGYLNQLEELFGRENNLNFPKVRLKSYQVKNNILSLEYLLC